MRNPIELRSGTVLLRDSSVLPDGIQLRTETALPGWRIIAGTFSADINREISNAGGHFFYLAEQLQAGALAFDQNSAMRRALTKIIRNVEEQNLNALEITGIRTKRFVGMHYFAIIAHARHIKKTPFLFDAANHSNAEVKAAARRSAA